MKLLATKSFNGVSLDCYQDETKQDDFWATREQIGELLEYENPRISIGNIHNRNKERLDKFSAVINLITEAGARVTTIYNFKGLLEICRFSNQPKANAVMDFLWEIADEILSDPDAWIKTLEASKDSILIGNLAKLLTQNGIMIGQNKPFAWLRENGRFISSMVS